MAIGVDCQLTVVFVVVKMSLVFQKNQNLLPKLKCVLHFVLTETVFLSLELELLHVAL